MAWTKVVLASRAFGQEKKKIAVDKTTFARDFIKELISNDKDYLSLQELLMQLDSTTKIAMERAKLLKATGQDKSKELALDREEDFFKSVSILFTLRRMVTLGIELHEAALSSNETDYVQSSIDRYDDRIESIMSFRKSARLVKQKFALKKTTTSQFLPISIGKYYGFPEVLYGVSELKVDPELSVLQSSVPSITFKVSNKQALYQSRAWIVYQFLYEATRSKELNIFPVPIGVSRDTATLTTTFSFENPACDSLSSIQGPIMSQLLRSNHSVILQWGNQLGFAYETLQRSSSCLIQRLTLQDAYIKKDGRLLLGSIAVSSKPNGVNNSVERFSEFMFELLTSLLSTSRRCNMKKQPSSNFKEEVVSVIEGSTIEMAFDDFNVQSITIDESASSKVDKNKKEVHSTTLAFKVKGDSGSASISVCNKNLNFSGSHKNPTLIIKGIKAGNFSLHTSEEKLTLPDQSIDDIAEVDESKAALPVIRVVVVPKTPVASVEVQELIAYLEESFASNKPLFLQSRCLQPVVSSSRKAAELTNDWLKINRTLDDMKIKTRL